MTASDERLAYSVKSFAKFSDQSIRFVKQEIYDGNLKAVKKGGKWWIPVESARAYWATAKEETREQEEVSQATA